MSGKAVSDTAELVVKVEKGAADSTPQSLDTPGKRTLFHNLKIDEEMALRVQYAVMEKRPNLFRDTRTKQTAVSSCRNSSRTGGP